jgi:hypothetical protein
VHGAPMDTKHYYWDFAMAATSDRTPSMEEILADMLCSTNGAAS